MTFDGNALAEPRFQTTAELQGDEFGYPRLGYYGAAPTVGHMLNLLLPCELRGNERGWEQIAAVFYGIPKGKKCLGW